MNNKKILIIFFFLLIFIWVLFFDDNSIFKQAKLNKKIQNLKNLKNYYQQKIKEDSLKINLINKGDLKFLEKIGREEMNMHKDNEDVYIITKVDKK